MQRVGLQQGALYCDGLRGKNQIISITLNSYLSGGLEVLFRRQCYQLFYIILSLICNSKVT